MIDDDKARRGSTRRLHDPAFVSRLEREGYRVLTLRTKVGRGWKTYRKAVAHLKAWGQLPPWTFVQPSTPARPGSPVCLSARVLGVWVKNPLKTV